MLEQKLNSEQKDETQLPSSPNNAKPNVVRSPNVVSTEKTVEDIPSQIAAKAIVVLLNNLSLPDALQACDIAKAWLPAQAYVQSRTPPC